MDPSVVVAFSGYFVRL